MDMACGIVVLKIFKPLHLNFEVFGIVSNNMPVILPELMSELWYHGLYIPLCAHHLEKKTKKNFTSESPTR